MNLPLRFDLPLAYLFLAVHLWSYSDVVLENIHSIKPPLVLLAKRMTTSLQDPAVHTLGRRLL